jgi:hypothetical protein
MKTTQNPIIPTRSPLLPSRLVELQLRTAEALPLASFQPAESQTQQPVLRISLQNGYLLEASTDPDLPWLLFEISRAVLPGDAKLEFEGSISANEAFTDKLSGGDAVDLIRKYAALGGAREKGTSHD